MNREISRNLIELSTITDHRGELSFIEDSKETPFRPSAVSWGSFVEFDKKNQMLIALKGNIELKLNQAQVILNNASQTLILKQNDELEYKKSSKDFLALTIELETAIAQEITDNRQHTAKDCTLINLKGNRLDAFPFPVKRIFYIYNIPTKTIRGEHANISCHELLFAVSGSFKVELDDGTSKRLIELNDSHTALYIPPGIWASQKEYSENAICLALASEPYREDGYIDNYDEFLKFRKE